MLRSAFGSIVQRLMELLATMNIGFLIPPSDCSSTSTSSSAVSEKGPLPQPAQGGTFSALLKDVAQNLSDEQLPPFSNSDDPIGPALSTEVDGQATGVALSGIAVASFVVVQNLPAAACPVDGKAESLEGSTKIQEQSTESIPLLPQGVTVVALSDNRTMGTESLPVDPLKLVTLDSSIDSLPRPVLDLDRSGEASARQEGARATEGLPTRNDRSALVALAPVYPEQQSGNQPLAAKMPPSSLITDQEPSPVKEDQGGKIVLPTASVNAGTQSLDRLSAGIQPSAMVQEQGAQATTLPGQSLLVSMTGVSEGGEQAPFGADAQGAGDGTFFRFGESGTPESATRGNQSQFFNGQFASALQAQSSAPGEGSPVVTPAADRLKMTQAFLGEDHSAAMTSASGKVQSVHVQLPSHDSTPLSVRISMTDQTVHTQFTTDQNDLGALLFARQEQLQQSLAKSGLELGQFQVHIDQRNQQESLPDRQSRRNGEAPEQQTASQDRNQQAQDRERQNQRSPRALSLFA
jgi:flagellar hook-length control protein FliK